MPPSLMENLSPGRRRRRWTLVPAIACVAALALSACGSSSAKTSSPSASATSAAAAFPVTIKTALGTTTIEKAPTKIVALADGDLDSLLALGIQPIGIGASSGDNGITWWAEPKLTGKPKVLEAGDNGYNVEEILALEPDLILAGSDYYIKDEYKALTASGIPVTAYESGPAEDSWQTTMRQVAKAVGKSAEGEKVISDVEGQVAKVKADTPVIVGKSFTLTQMYEAGSIGVLRSKADAGVKLLNDFGLVLSPAASALEGDEFAVQLSLEKLNLLDSDILMTYFAEPKLQPSLEGNSLFKGLSVVKDGGYTSLTNAQFSALRVPTPLSVPYTIENVVPILTKVAEGKG